MRVRCVIVLAAFLLPLPMMADTTYYYTGTDFTDTTGAYTTSDSINAWFTVASPLPANLNTAGDLDDITALVTAFSFSDGVQTLSNSTPGVQYEFAVVTDVGANIFGWNIGAFISDATSGYTIDEIASSGMSEDGSGFGEDVAFDNYGTDSGATDIPGAWAMTPEPSSIILLLTGMAGIAGVARRKFSRA
jgi:hypothetical protein